MKLLQIEIALTDNSVYVIRGTKSTASKQKKVLLKAFEDELDELKREPEPDAPLPPPIQDETQEDEEEEDENL